MRQVWRLSLLQQPLTVHINPHNSLHSPHAGVRMRPRADAAQGERGRAQEKTTRIQGVLPVAAASSLSPSGSGPWTVTHW